MEARAIEFINKLASTPGNDEANSIWYSIAACAFTGCNEGSMAAHIYRAAIARFPDNAEARRTILRRMKESLINGAFIYGNPRLLNAFYPLVESIPDQESVDRVVVRKDVQNPYDMADRGEAYMSQVFGAADKDRFLQTMDDYFPDLRKLVVNYCYGMYQSERSVLTSLDMSRLTLASLVAMDVPKQLSWHMRGFINLGGTREELIKTLEIAKTIVDITGARLKNEIPDVDKAITAANLV